MSLLDQLDITKYDEVLVVSPHFDDAALSCSSLLSLAREKGVPVKVLNVFSGNEKDERAGHARPSDRRSEDEKALGFLGCSIEFLGLQDAIFRKDSKEDFVYRIESIFLGSPHPKDPLNPDKVIKMLKPFIDSKKLLVAPLGVGLHVDHLLCFHAAGQAPECDKLFYEDWPYVLKPRKVEERFSELGGSLQGPISGGSDPELKEKIVSCYSTQIEDMFGSNPDLRSIFSARDEVFWSQLSLDPEGAKKQGHS